MTVLIQLTGIHKRYGSRILFDGMSAAFSDDQKIGVIGRNGSGKSTLCKIITGHDEADRGELVRSRDLRLSYLEQHDPFTLEETAIGFLRRYTGKEEWQCAEMAWRFQLTNEILAQTVGGLPGGYRTRVKLTAMLLAHPNFLILDEPTNYLDLKTLILVENFLQDYDGGFLLVSHDRELLKRTCEQTLELENGLATLYPGTVDEYLVFKEERREQAENYNKNVRAKQEQLQEFIDRFRAKASTASRAKSKLKQISKLKTIEIGHTLSTVRIRIPSVEPRSGFALTCDHLAIGYPEKLVASEIEMNIDRGRRVAVLGDNGQGKTTFLRTIAGDLAPKEGAFRWANGLKLGYYAQHVFGRLDPNDQVLGYLERNAPDGVTRQHVLELAGNFLFKDTDVEKKIGVLSGGERARLVLAGLLLAKCQVLLLDEPTNHLDFETVEALGVALREFKGTIFFISHDRTFVNLVATEIVEVKDGRILKYPGTYEDYAYHLELEAQGVQQEENRLHEQHVKAQPAELRATPPTPEERRRQSAEKRAEVTKLKKLIEKSETRLKNLTHEKNLVLEEIQSNPFHYSRRRNEKLKEFVVWIEEEEASWLRLQTALEALKEKN